MDVILSHLLGICHSNGSIHTADVIAIKSESWAIVNIGAEEERNALVKENVPASEKVSGHQFYRQH